MDRRSFLKLSPAVPAGAVSAVLVLREEGKEPVELGISVLKAQSGDVLVLTVPGAISQETAARLRAQVEAMCTGLPLKAMILSDGVKIDGVIRGMS